MSSLPENPLAAGHFGPLEAWLCETLGATRVEIARAEKLSGGAVQENWRIDALVEGGQYEGAQRWVLRTDAAASLSVSLDRTSEFGVLSAAYNAGIKVAQPVARCEGADLTGAPFMLQVYQPGEAQARREAETARQVTDFLVDLFEVADPESSLGETITAKEILENGAERIAGDLAEEGARQRP